MTKLPRGLSWRKCLRALARRGFRVHRQTGGHLILRRDDPFSQVTLPRHRALNTGTLRSILNDAEITVDDFVRAL